MTATTKRKVQGRKLNSKPRAATADILGPKPRAPRIPSKWREYYDRLVELRDQLARSQSDLARDVVAEHETYSLHMADAATDHYDRDWALGMLSAEQNSVYQIEQAIDRIHNGTYGVCELTGKPIEKGRLEAIPWTRFSAKAERELEAQGARKRTRLGDRHAVTRTSGEEDFEGDDEGT